MKNLKFLLPLIAVVFAVAGVFAMKANKTIKTHPDAVGYYQFTGSDPTDASQRVNANNYQYVDPNSPTGACATGSTLICGVKTDGDGTHPDIGTSGPLYNALLNNDMISGVTFYHDPE